MFRKEDVPAVWMEIQCLPVVGRTRYLNSVLTGISKLCLESSLHPLRARGLLIVKLCFSFGDVVTKSSCLVLYIYLFGPATAPFHVVVQPYNRVTLLSASTHNVT
jgi:hypothetical protein